MKRFHAVRALAFACSLLFLLSCHKRHDFEVACKIMKLTEHYQFHPSHPVETRVATFQYNAWGNPHRVTWDQSGTGKPNLLFRYDKQQRLKEFITQYSSTSFDTYYKYIWSGNKIVADTLFFSGYDINDPGGTAMWYSLHYYIYDSEGRVIRIDEDPAPGHPAVNKTFQYDANGNLVAPGVTYDDKVNYLRTNAVFMFIHRNFSKNNRTIADAYNYKGLPTTVSGGSLSWMYGWANEIEYSCGHRH